MKEKLSILLAEDNVLNQKIVTFNLKKYQHEVIIANNGKEALEIFKKFKFDVVLMDIMMPVMDGLDATRHIREFENQNHIEEQTPIIAFTANTMDNDREKCFSYGMNEFMAKPFDMERLNQIFKKLHIHE